MGTMTCICDDPCDVWDETWRTARVAHRCCECHEQIDPGDRYLEICQLYDGRWWRDCCCECCDLDWRRLMDAGYCRESGGLAEIWPYAWEA